MIFLAVTFPLKLFLLKIPSNYQTFIINFFRYKRRWFTSNYKSAGVPFINKNKKNLQYMYGFPIKINLRVSWRLEEGECYSSSQKKDQKMNQKLFTYQSSPYFSKDFLTLFLIILGNITFASPFNWGLYQVIHVFHNYYQLHMKFVNVLIFIQFVI